MTDRVLIDTGPLVAIFSDRDEHHGRCVEALKSLPAPLLTCWPVVTETAWLLRNRMHSLYQFFDGVANGLFSLLPLDDHDLAAVVAIMRRYETAGVQIADASLAHLADREGIRTVFTTDRRDFSVIRLKRNRALRLIPDTQ